MNYRDLAALNDAASTVREQVERWDSLMRSSYAASDLAFYQDFTRQIESSPARSLAVQVAEAGTTAAQGYKDLTARMDTLMGRSLGADVAEVAAGVRRENEALIAKMHVGNDLTELAAGFEDQVRQTSALLSAGLEIDRTASLNRMIRSSLVDIDWTRLHGAFLFGEELARLTADLTSAYRELALEPLANEQLFTMHRLPAVELYAHASLLRSLGHSGAAAPAQQEEDEEEAEESRLHEEIQSGSRANLYRLLAEYHPDLLELWLGAREALSNKHDAVRKYCSSQRALLKRLLLTAAPDSEVKAWTAIHSSSAHARGAPQPGAAAWPTSARGRPSRATHTSF